MGDRGERFEAQSTELTDIYETTNSQPSEIKVRIMIRLKAMKVLATVAVIIAGAVGALLYFGASPSSNATAAAPASQPSVDVVKLGRETLVQRVQSNATLEAFEDADLFAKVSGYLSDVRVDIGDHVKAGQVLAVIDVPEMKQELAEAQAQLESKKSSLESARRQLDHHKADVALQNALAKDREQLGQGRQFISDRTLDQVHANADIAKADLGVAEANRDLAANQIDLAAATVEKIKTLLTYTQIVAPFDGVVARRLVNRGDLVQAATSTRTTPLFKVQRIDTIRVFCDVPENEVLRVRVGDRATVKVLGLNGEPIVGAITRFAHRLDPETRNMRTEIDLPNTDERLYPGMYAEVSLEVNPRHDVLAVPVAAIGSDAQGTFVFTVQDDRIQRKAVKVGVRDNGRAEVIDGLSENAAVVAAAKSAPGAGTVVKSVGPR
jgi:RND family efflux transporter MFP subunit